MQCARDASIDNAAERLAHCQRVADATRRGCVADEAVASDGDGVKEGWVPQREEEQWIIGQRDDVAGQVAVPRGYCGESGVKRGWVRSNTVG